MSLVRDAGSMCLLPLCVTNTWLLVKSKSTYDWAASTGAIGKLTGCALTSMGNSKVTNRVNISFISRSLTKCVIIVAWARMG